MPQSTGSARLFPVALLTCLLAMSGCARSAVAPEEARRYEEETFLKGSRGPYRGRVIDAETKQPLAGAAVVAIWSREQLRTFYFLAFSRSIVFHTAREVLTDANGEFVLQAEDIERNAPWRTMRPEFVIFAPGYGSFPGHQVSPKETPYGLFEGAGATVELRRLTTRKERIEALYSMPPGNVPYELIPNLLRLTDVEAVSLGLKPLLRGK